MQPRQSKTLFELSVPALPQILRQPAHAQGVARLYMSSLMRVRDSFVHIQMMIRCSRDHKQPCTGQCFGQLVNPDTAVLFPQGAIMAATPPPDFTSAGFNSSVIALVQDKTYNWIGDINASFVLQSGYLVFMSESASILYKE